MSASELMARMAEHVVSASPGDTLVALGLGSCIGLTLIDRASGVAGLAHVVLPTGSPQPGDKPAKWGTSAVPALIADMRVAGSRGLRLEAVLVGGASMFAGAAGGLEVGQRNEAAVREALRARRIPVVAHATGGGRGRTVRVAVGPGRVSVREAGGTDVVLWPAPAAARGRA